MDLKGRTALVTGGGVRVGRAICLALGACGAKVFVHYNSSEGPAEAVRDEIIAAGGSAAVGAGDLFDPSSAGALIDAASEALGPVSILVNSASGFSSDDVGSFTVDGFHKTQAVSLEAPIMLTQALATSLPDGLDASVVNITDVRTTQPYRGHLSYMLAKGGVDTFTRTAALDLAPQIRVNAVALGVILPPPGEGDDYATKLASTLPLARVGGTEVVADTVVFLCQNDFITGEIIRVDGGGHLQ
jgi:NAD(P)-dependent dehydrogenase (short-subunit alcohol dehydrogenase family)